MVEDTSNFKARIHEAVDLGLKFELKNLLIQAVGLTVTYYILKQKSPNIPAIEQYHSLAAALLTTDLGLMLVSDYFQDEVDLKFITSLKLGIPITDSIYYKYYLYKLGSYLHSLNNGVLMGFILDAWLK